MKLIPFKKLNCGSGDFRAKDYRVRFCGIGIAPVLCAPATTRLFKLPRGTQEIAVKFTKTPPKDVPRYYEIRPQEKVDDMWSRRKSANVQLVGYRGEFLGGVTSLLEDMYKKGERYVTVLPIR